MGKSSRKRKAIKIERALNNDSDKCDSKHDLNEKNWKTFWDNNRQCYYYWNKVTNRSTYTYPLLSNYINNPQMGKSQNKNLYTDHVEYRHFMEKEYDYSSVKFGDSINMQYSEVKDGEYCKLNTVNPKHLDSGDRAKRQCQAFFDYENYVEQRGEEAKYSNYYGINRQAEFTKRQIEVLQRKKKEKKEAKKRQWLMEI
ncbi:hypothetical protein K502DRAFT_358738 [Neoconidiobolus thromboides FSU 785]|nr:hypothetical protein K502DRAFT_358738 [Neoconidiobolus thromboides FSU 785]